MPSRSITRYARLLALVSPAVLLALSLFAVPLGHALSAPVACPAIDGAWSDGRSAFVVTSVRDVATLTYDSWNVPGPLHMIRVAGECTYAGPFRTRRTLVVEPTGGTSVQIYEGTATLTVRGASTLALDLVGRSHGAGRPTWDRTDFHVWTILSRTR